MSTTTASARPIKPNGPAPAPTAAPPAPPQSRPAVNGHAKGKKKAETPVDPATMYDVVKNRIAALEEEEVHEEEESRKYAEEAQKSVKGMSETAIHAKYIELFAEFKRLERDHAKEKQKLMKDKDSTKSALTKANQSKTKVESLARELQKARSAPILRAVLTFQPHATQEDGKRLAQSVEDAQDELIQMRNDINKRAEKAKAQDAKYREMPDIVVKVVCRYRAELFFKISRKTKLSRLFNAWTDRMEKTGGKKGGTLAENAAVKPDAPPPPGSMQFIFTHNGRTVEADQTPEEAGMEDADEIVAVELMDLTEGPGTEEWDDLAEPRRQKLKKNWTDDPHEAKRSLTEIFDGVVRERLKEVLRQYELRERHFECVIRSKELEVLLSRARAAEQKQLAENEKTRSEKHAEEIQQVRKDLEDARSGQTKLIDKLIQCCKEPNAERTQRLFTSLREELEKKGTKIDDLPADAPGVVADPAEPVGVGAN
ncbi:hypothetical protein MKEN_01278400 [Mycena kentingensis (nom. inval.)]|nr:hypothetical protein MKEN_01278400 [Mycena kentingensis (nom. inval.)]